MRSLVVIPTYNEHGTIESLLKELLTLEPAVDALVVDDGSPDGTADVVESLAARQPRVHLLRRSGKLGLGSAYREGFAFALAQGFEHVVTMDGDLSHDPAAVPSLLAEMNEADLVIGSRYVPGGSIVNWKAHRRWLSSFANLYTRVLLRLDVRDSTSGFRCYGRKVLETIEPDQMRASGYAFLEEMVWRVHHAGFRIREVPIQFVDRHLGRSKIDRTEIVKAAFRVAWAALRKPPVRRVRP